MSPADLDKRSTSRLLSCRAPRVRIDLLPWVGACLKLCRVADSLKNKGNISQGLSKLMIYSRLSNELEFRLWYDTH